VSVTRCPDCTYGALGECRTCRSSRYVHRNDHGRITRPATAKEFFESIPAKKPGPRPSPQGYRRKR